MGPALAEGRGPGAAAEPQDWTVEHGGHGREYYPQGEVSVCEVPQEREPDVQQGGREVDRFGKNSFGFKTNHAILKLFKI